MATQGSARPAHGPAASAATDEHDESHGHSLASWTLVALILVGHVPDLPRHRDHQRADRRSSAASSRPRPDRRPGPADGRLRGPPAGRAQPLSLAARTGPAATLLARARAAREPLAVAALVVVGTAYVAAVDPNEAGHYPTCPFLYLTGYACPGCGTLRAVHDLATGHPVDALQRNPLAVAAAPGCRAGPAGLDPAGCPGPAPRLGSAGLAAPGRSWPWPSVSGCCETCRESAGLGHKRVMGQ